MQQLMDCADGVRLREILPDGRFFGSQDIHLRSCCSDWRSCQPGDVYVALVGSETDGHDHVQQAVQRGAIAVVGERLLPTRVPNCVVGDSREAYGKICQRLAGQPDQRLQTVGVTGTLGKTTTALLVAAVLDGADRPTGITSSLGYCDGQETHRAEVATPAPPQLARHLRNMAANGCTNAVVEVSSEALATRQIAGLAFDAAILTNLRRDHLDQHGSLLNYRRAKLRLFEYLKPRGFAVLNLDDPTSMELSADISAPLMTVGIRAQAELRAQVIDRCPSEQTFLLMAGNEAVPVRTRTVGDPYIYCCLSAAAVGLVMGIDLPRIAHGLESIQYVPGRLERLECGQSFGVFVDEARTADALRGTLRTLQQVTSGRVLCVYGAAHWQDAEQRAAIGRVAERGADVGVITSTHPGHQQPLRIAHDILDGFQRPGRAHVIPDRTKAIHWALSEAQAGDSVLIAGRGSDTYQVIGNRQLPLDDREVARRWLYGYRPKLAKVTSTAILPMRLGCQWN